MKAKPFKEQLPLGLPDNRPRWPEHDRFPRNADGTTVGEQLLADLCSSPEPLVITGYAGVEHVLTFLHMASDHLRSCGSEGCARILIGAEPHLGPSLHARLGAESIEPELMDYWLKRSVSILQWPALLASIELLESGHLLVRSSGGTRIHAKVYIGERAVTLGSSNFTEPGLKRNLEANVRFTASEDAARFGESSDLAEKLWSLGHDFNEGFSELLTQLLRKVSWEEALARACGLLLEADWASPALAGIGTGPPLWPSQEQGIAQAMWVLENVGSVLIADATGAGKTLMGAALVRALQDRNLRTGRGLSRSPVLISPKTVQLSWRREFARVGASVDVFSHGMLSRGGSDERAIIEGLLEQTQLLAIDEAHNFLNRTSTRSRLVYGNGADHLVLLTATPINRGVKDLVSIVDLLGADNFDEGVLKIVGRLGVGGRTTSGTTEEEARQIRGALQSFVVRRTKSAFNHLVDREPDRYRNALGNRCRFPVHRPKILRRKDPPGDRERALQIQSHASELLGLTFLTQLVLSPTMRRWGWTEGRYLEMKLSAASGLAAYQVLSRLRSSRAALVEHIAGSTHACDHFGIARRKATSSGDVVSTLEGMKEALPLIKLSVPLPVWMTDLAEYERAVEQELTTYRAIQSLVVGMSDHRLDQNGTLLTGLLDGHHRILAFDSHPISLFQLEEWLKARGAADVRIATGDSTNSQKLKFAKDFGLRASQSRMIGLCSDALAEGVNLQGASAVVNLDMPTVVRVVEQRLGRVDRMDSPHEEVEVHWPKELPEFQLKADGRLLDRLKDVKELLGSNVPLPEELEDDASGESLEGLEVREAIRVVEQVIQEGRPEFSLVDAFARVRGLVFGDESIVDEALYERLRHSTARVLSSVSVVSAERPWAFLAVGAADRGVPRWLLVDLAEDSGGSVLGGLDQVADSLRQRLTGPVADLGFDDVAAEVLASAIESARTHQRELLPLRKHRALDEMVRVLEHYHHEATGVDNERAALLSGILSLVAEDHGSQVDLGRLADWWLNLIRPEWVDYLARPFIARPARLWRLTKELKKTEISTERLSTIRDVQLRQEPLERRVVAAIVGVGTTVSREVS